jgi:ABC-type nitrate/sulfonate/bicarbonate transport system substrate-binding protein
MVPEKSGITRPAELVGKRIQYPGAPGPGGTAIAATMAQADGASCGPNDFVPVNHGFEHTNALDSGVADAATLVFYNFEVVEAEERGLKPRYFPLKTWGVPDFCQLHFIADEHRVQTDEPLFRAFIAVLQRGIDFIHEHPDEAWALYKRYAKQEQSNRLSDRIYQATIGCFCHDLSMSDLYWERLVTWMVDTGQIQNRIEAAPCFDNRFAF